MHILLLTDSFSLGGAETHILTLGTALVRRGHTVTLASSGGVLCGAAREHGMRVLYAPLNSKSPRAMLASGAFLARLLRRERITVIHAHARLPAALVSPLAHRYRIPLVTTVHGIYSARFPKKLLTAHGAQILAVSDPIKRHLTDAFGVKATRIFRTVNGIDLAAFPFRPAQNAQIREVLHVSRLDDDADFTARALISLAPAFPGLHFTVVGGGRNEALLRQRAAAVPNLTFLGARKDIAALLARADLFIGVSRAALEALATGTPVILCGNRGIDGLFTPRLAARAERTNLCCDGAGRERARLARALGAALALTEEERRALSRFGRRFVRARFAASRMADDAEAVYRAVTGVK